MSTADTDPGAKPAWRRALYWAGDALEPEMNPSGAIYGTITAGALLAAESTQRETTGEALGAVVVALILYWLAHAYSHALGERLEHNRQLSAKLLVSELRRSAAIIRGSTLPLAALAIAWALGAAPHQAVLVALFSAAASLVLLELIAALRAHCSTSELLTQLGVSSLLGVGILALKVVLH